MTDSEKRYAAAELLADVAIRHVRPDVPDDVIEAIGVMLDFIAAEARDLDALVDDGPEAAQIRGRRQTARAEAITRWEQTCG